MLQADGDAVERAVLALAADKAAAVSAPETAAGGVPEGGDGFDLVAAAEWPGVPEDAVLLSPPQGRALWRQFASDSAYSVQQVPPWAWAPPKYDCCKVRRCTGAHGADEPAMALTIRFRERPLNATGTVSGLLPCV